LQVQFEGDAGSLVIDGTVYHLKQLHWHTPAEHRVDGHNYDMELHLVHQTPENKTAVVAVLYEDTVPARRDPFLAKLEHAIGQLCDRDPKKPPIRKKVDPNDVGFKGDEYYRFSGSLTTPSCAEGIVWTVIPRV
jgi:carbonic anhydrase